MRLFSDLLLHDISTGDGIAQGNAAATEVRTPPLWALRLRHPLLHDGRASSIDEAIQMHGETATPAREAYEALTENRRWALLEMLVGL